MCDFKDELWWIVFGANLNYVHAAMAVVHITTTTIPSIAIAATATTSATTTTI